MSKVALSTKVNTTSRTNKVKKVRQVEPKEEIREIEETILENTQELTFKQRLDVLIQAQQSQMLVLKSQIQELRKLQREHEHLIKDASKKSKKKNKKDIFKNLVVFQVLENLLL